MITALKKKEKEKKNQWVKIKTSQKYKVYLIKYKTSGESKNKK